MCNACRLSRTNSLGSCPFARRYLGNHSCFLLVRLLRCFSSPTAPQTSYGFRCWCHDFNHGGLPHSDSPGSSLDCSSPRRFAACRVLLRPSAPRHPPRALCSLITIPPSKVSNTFGVLTLSAPLLHSCTRRDRGIAPTNTTSDALVCYP